MTGPGWITRPDSVYGKSFAMEKPRVIKWKPFCGGSSNCKMYLEGFPYFPFYWCIAWVGNVMTPGESDFEYRILLRCLVQNRLVVAPDSFEDLDDQGCLFGGISKIPAPPIAPSLPKSFKRLVRRSLKLPKVCSECVREPHKGIKQTRVISPFVDTSKKVPLRCFTLDYDDNQEKVSTYT